MAGVDKHKWETSRALGGVGRYMENLSNALMIKRIRDCGDNC